MSRESEFYFILLSCNIIFSIFFFEKKNPNPRFCNGKSISMAPPARMAMTRRVHPLVSLNPYQGNWTIKVRVTSKANLRPYRNARGEGCVFSVELTDEEVGYLIPLL